MGGAKAGRTVKDCRLFTTGLPPWSRCRPKGFAVQRAARALDSLDSHVDWTYVYPGSLAGQSNKNPGYCPGHRYFRFHALHPPRGHQEHDVAAAAAAVAVVAVVAP